MPQKKKKKQNDRSLRQPLSCDLKQIRRDMFAVTGVPRGAKVCEDAPATQRASVENVTALVTRAAPRFTNNNTFAFPGVLHGAGVGDEITNPPFV